VALFVGILAAVLSGGPLLHAGGLTLLLWVQAAVAVLAALWVLAAVRAPAAFPGDPSVAVSLRWLREDRFMWLLAGLLFVGMGVFNAVATWLDSILTHFGRGGASGYLVAIMTVGGIVGGALLPDLVAKRDQRRRLLETAVVVTAVAFAVMAVAHNPAVGGAVLFVAGFFLLAGLPVVLDWSELHAGPERAGEAAGFLLLSGNLGGVILALIVQAMVGNPYLSLGALCVVCLGGLALATKLPVHRAAATPEGVPQ
jgi:predicted MFS family arabinose efflux permease